jgi:hypothetical protein
MSSVLSTHALVFSNLDSCFNLAGVMIIEEVVEKVYFYHLQNFHAIMKKSIAEIKTNDLLILSFPQITRWSSKT